MWKKIALGFLGFIVLVIAALAIIPFIIDIDKYRPQVIEIVNQNLNGKFDVGHLKLSLWGQIEIDIDGISVVDQGGKDVVRVGKAYAQIPFSSIMAGQPRLTIKFVEPQITVTKDPQGKMNVMTLVKAQPEGAAPVAKPVEEPAKQIAPQDIPFFAIIAASGIDFAMTDARFIYQDAQGAIGQKFDKFNVLLSDISMQRPMTLKLWSDIETKVGKDLSVKGPFKINGTIAPKFDGLKFQSVGLDMVFSFDDILLDIPGTFTKPAGRPTNIQLVMQASPEEVIAKTLNVNFLDVTAKADLALENLKAPPEKFNFHLDLAHPGVDLKVGINLVSFEKPDVKVDVKSQGIDLDVLFPPPPGGRAKPVAAAEAPKAKAGDEKGGEGKVGGDGGTSGQGTKTAAAEPATDVDKSLESVRTNEFLKNLGAQLTVAIKQIKGFNQNITNLELVTSFRTLVASIDKFHMGIYEGLVASSAAIDLKPQRPEYKFQATIAKINVNDAVLSQFPSFQNTIRGILSFDTKGNGSSLNADLLLKNLDMAGKFAFADAEFKSMDIGKMVDAAVSGSVKDIAKDIPGLPTDKLKSLPAKASRYKSIGSGFKMHDGIFSAPDFFAESLKGEGIDIKGATTVDLVNDKLDAKWAVIDTYNKTGLADVAVNYQGVKVEKIFVEGKGPIQFPVIVGCKMSEPCFKYDAIPAYLLGVASKKLKGQLTNLLKARVSQEVDKLKGKANEKIAEKKKELEEKKKVAEQKAKQKAKDEAQKQLKGKIKGLGL